MNTSRWPLTARAHANTILIDSWNQPTPTPTLMVKYAHCLLSYVWWDARGLWEKTGILLICSDPTAVCVCVCVGHAGFHINTSKSWKEIYLAVNRLKGSMQDFSRFQLILIKCCFLILLFDSKAPKIFYGLL